MKLIPASLAAGALVSLLACPGGGSSGSNPTVVSTTPANGATGVAITTGLTVTFSEAMDCSTLSTATLGEAVGGTNVAGTVSCNGATATFTPSASLSAGATYTATVQTGVKSTGGLALAAAVTWSYATAGAAGTPPLVVTTIPTQGATAVAVTTGLSVTFNEAMDCSTFSTATFGESVGGVSVAGTVGCSGTTATFTPSASLSAGTTYLAAVQNGVKSAQEVALAATATWTFTTASGAGACASGTDGGQIYVADFGNERIVRSDDMCGDNWTTLSEYTESGVAHNFGEEDVFVASDGKIYVADTFNDRIVRMDDMSGANAVSYGTVGTGTGQFTTPRTVFVDDTGHIYITDGFNFARIVRMDDMTGTNWTTYPAPGVVTSPFKEVWGLFVDSTHHIYVTDNDGSNDTVSRVVRMDDMNGTNFVSFGTFGSGVYQFDRPWGISVDANGKIYIADGPNQRIVRIDDMNGTNWTTLGTLGTGTGQFFDPVGIFVDAAFHIYVADYGGNLGYGADDRIVRMDDMAGTNWTTLGTSGAGLKEFSAPTSVWVH